MGHHANPAAQMLPVFFKEIATGKARR